MGVVRPTSDIASFPGAGWTTAPLFSKVNSAEPDDTTFITAPVLDTEDPQVAFGLADLEIPFGSSGRIEVSVRMRWTAALTAAPAAVRIGLTDAVDLGVDNPTLLFERSLSDTDIFAFTGDTLLEFQEFEVAFDYEDFSGDAAAFGIYVEMTPDAADTTQQGQIAFIELLSCVPAVIVNVCSLGTLTPEIIIEEARDHHVTFNPRTHPDGPLLRLLSSYQRTILSKIARINPALFASEVLITLPFDDFDAGVKLPANTYVLPNMEVRLTDANLKEPIDLVNLTLRAEFDMPLRFAYLRGNNIFLGRDAETFENFDLLILQLVLTPKDLVGLRDPLLLPDWGVDTFVAHLVKKMGVRSDMSGNVLLDAEQMEQDFLMTVAQQKGAEVGTTLDVWPTSF